ncbi:MAG TPA: hypothetical protein V6C65_10535 [Allocoleopsis sp.]
MAQSVSAFLRSKMKEFLAKKGESLRWLSKHAQIDYQKLYRLESGESKAFSFFDAKRLLKFIEPNRHLEILREFYPQEMQEVSDIATPESEADQTFAAIERVVSSEQNYLFYLDVVQTIGADRAFVEKKYGSNGLELLDGFLKSGALSEADGKFHGVMDNLLIEPSKLLRTVCKVHIDMIDVDELPGGFGAHSAKGLNLEGRKEAYNIITEAWHRLESVYKNPAFRGDEITLFSLFFGSVKRGQS